MHPDHPALTAAWLRAMFALIGDAPGGYLHFGLWTGLPRDVDRLGEAQEAFTQLVLRRLDLRQGMAVLDVGAGVGGIAKRLVEAGAVVTAVCPDPTHAAATRMATSARVLEQRFEDLTDPGPYDRILFSESFGFPASTLGAEAVLDRCRQRLLPGGVLLVADFLPDRLLTALQAHPAFVAEPVLDVTAEVAFTLDALQARYDRLIRPWHELVLAAMDAGDPPLGEAVRARLAATPNVPARALLAGRLDVAESLEQRPYRFLRLVAR